MARLIINPEIAFLKKVYNVSPKSTTYKIAHFLKGVWG